VETADRCPRKFERFQIAGVLESISTSYLRLFPSQPLQLGKSAFPDA